MKVMLDKLLKEFDKDFDTRGGLPDGYSDWDNYYFALKSFLQIFAKDLLQSVGEEVEGMKKPERVDDGAGILITKVYNQALSDLRVRLKEMEKGGK